MQKLRNLSGKIDLSIYKGFFFLSNLNEEIRAIESALADKLSLLLPTLSILPQFFNNSVLMDVDAVM